MSSLRELAKTANEILDWVYEITLQCRPYDESLAKERQTEERQKIKWVPVEAHEAKVKELEGKLEAIEKLLEEFPDYNKEVDNIGGMETVGVQYFAVLLSKWQDKLRGIVGSETLKTEEQK